jgi:uncharacterized membrane protein
MPLFPLFKKKELLTIQEKNLVVEAIGLAEKQTSGEVRVYMESRCKYVEPLERAAEIFYGLKMEQTTQHNAVLVYVAVKDRQLAIFGDEGIHQKTGQQFWNNAVQQMLLHFNNRNYGSGIVTVVTEIGEALHTHFPYDGSTDKNELPDDIVFGR